MLKRATRSPLALCIVLAASLALAVVPSTDALARVDMSVGQAGDPNDGEDVYSGGSGTTGLGESEAGGTKIEDVRSPYFLLMPMIVAGVLLFKVVILPVSSSVSR